MTRIRKFAWLGYCIAVAGAAMMLISFETLRGAERKTAGYVGFALMFIGSTIKLYCGLREQKKARFADGASH